MKSKNVAFVFLIFFLFIMLLVTSTLSEKKNKNDLSLIEINSADFYSRMDRSIAFLDAGEIQVNGFENYGLIGRRGFPYCKHGFWGEVRWIIPFVAVPPQAWATNIKKEDGTIVDRSQYYNVIESWTCYLCEPEHDTNFTDWEAMDGSRTLLRGEETWAQYPLTATSTIPNSWPQGYIDKNPTSATFRQFFETPGERHWPGYWAIDANPNSLTYGESKIGQFVSDKDIYFIMNDKYNGIRLGDGINVGYPIGFDMEVTGHSFSAPLFEDMVFLNFDLIFRNDIIDPNRQFHSGTIDSLYFGFLIDADLPGRDPEGYTMDPWGEDDYYYADILNDIISFYDKDGYDRDDDDINSEGPVSVYSFAFLETPNNVGLTGHHFLEESDFDALSNGQQVERILFAMASGRKSILPPEEQRMFFHGVNPHFDDYDSLRYYQERYPVDHRPSHFFLFSSGPFSISSGDTIPIHIGLIGGEDNPGVLDADGFGTNPPDMRFADTYKKLATAEALNKFKYARHPLTLQSLNDGGIFSGIVNIKWELISATGNQIDNVDIYYSRDSGKSWLPIVISAVNSGTYSWNTTDVLDGIFYRVKIYATDNLLFGQTESAEDFTINNPGNAAPELQVLSPLGGFTATETVPLFWSAGDADGDSIFMTFQYSWDYGDTWENIATNEPNDGFFEWDTKRSANSPWGKLRIIAGDGTEADTVTSLGYITVFNERAASPDQNFNHITGYGNESIFINLIDINEVKNHVYQITFDDSSNEESTLYSIRDLTENEIVFEKDVMYEDIEGAYFNGCRLQFDLWDNLTYYNSWWEKGGTTTNWIISDLTHGNSRIYGKFEIRYLGGAADTIFNNIKTVPFQVWNMFDNPPQKMSLAAINPALSVLQNGDRIFILSQVNPARIAWSFTISWPEGNEIPPLPEDIFIQETTIPFTHQDTLTFTVATTEVEKRRIKSTITNFALNQNYPNPFNQATTINFQIPKPTYVKIKIYDILGRTIQTLTNKNYPSGNYSLVWNGKNNYNMPVASGIYFYRIQANRFTQVKKMILVR